MFYYITKSYLTIVESLLLFSGDYRPTYTKRTEVFNQVFKQKFPRLANQLPDLVDEVNFYHNFKKTQNRIEREVLASWDKCRRYLGIVFHYCLEQFLAKKLPIDQLPLVGELKSKLAKKYFNPYISYLLNRRHLDNWLFEKLGAWTAQIFMSWKYFFLLKKDLGKFYWPAFSFKDPGVKILYILPLILYGIEINNQQNREMLSLAAKELRSLYPIKQDNLDWSEIKAVWMKAYRLYYLQRFV